MKLPNFFIAGFSKSGTTSLYHYLKQHPQIYMSPVKEPNFFADGEKEKEIFYGPALDCKCYEKYSDYLELFAGVRDEIAIGEASGSNAGKRGCDRIRQYVPHAKIIFILRHPADKIYSHFNHLRRDLIEPYDRLADAISHELSGGRVNWAYFLRYCHDTFFYDKLKYYFDSFPEEQIRVYLYEDWFTDPVSILRDIFIFLDVDHDFIVDISQKHNVGVIPVSRTITKFFKKKYSRKVVEMITHFGIKRDFLKYIHDQIFLKKRKPMDPSLRSFLTEHFKDDIVKTQNLIKRDISHWLY
jgi:hypothetical protein